MLPQTSKVQSGRTCEEWSQDGKQGLRSQQEPRKALQVRQAPSHTYSQQRPATDHRLPGRQGHPGAAVLRLKLEAPRHGGLS